MDTQQLKRIMGRKKYTVLVNGSDDIAVEFKENQDGELYINIINQPAPAPKQPTPAAKNE